MRKMTETTGFAMQLQHVLLDEVGTAVRGRSSMSFVLDEGFLTDLDLGTGGGVEGFGDREVCGVLPTAERMLTGDGSGVSGPHELALARGKRLVERIEATPRYGAPGECPRRIPA